MSATAAQQATPEPVDANLKLVLPGRVMPAGSGWDWIARGWPLFTRAPLMWIISMVVVLVLAIALSLVPFIGSIAYQVIQAVIAGGFVAACHSLQKGGDFELEQLFSGFSRRFAGLALIGVLLLAGWVVILLVFALFIGFSVLGAMIGGNTDAILTTIAASTFTILAGAFVMMVLLALLAAAYWFAPALVMMHGISPVAAMRESFFASMRNWLSLLVYGLVMMLLAIVAAIPFGLGFIVWVPLAIASSYVAYRDIFTEEVAESTVVAP